jgi:hypothetical protein
MPVFLLLMGFFADAANTYLIQASMWSTAMDCTRRMSVGQYTTVATARTCVQNQLLYAYKFASSDITPTYGSTDDTIEISLPFYKAGMFGVLAVFGGFTGTNFKLDVKTTMRAET